MGDVKGMETGDKKGLEEGEMKGSFGKDMKLDKMRGWIKSGNWWWTK